MEKVRTRFAPSPTGTPESIHLGFVIRALWNYAYAKKNNGQFILRIEDTDQKRSDAKVEKAIISTLKAFGISWDEGPDVGGDYGPYRQSERLEKYQKAAHELVNKGFAYYDFDADVRDKEEIKNAYKSKEKLAILKERPKARYEDPQMALERVKKGEKFVVRIKIPEDRSFEYEDWILKKKVKFFGKEVSDMILLKSDGFPTYHLAVVVDDVEMEISHVFRGQEWISSTPIHLFVYEGLGYRPPKIGHFSVILDPRTGKKFSKRDMTAMFGVKSWLEKGYLPEAILNYLMLLGWAPKDNKEFFTLEEFVQSFDQDGIQKANPTFDTKKLDWFNQHYIQERFINNKIGSKQEFVNFISSASKYSKHPNFKRIVENSFEYMPSRMKNIEDYDKLMKYVFEKNENIQPIAFTDNYRTHLSLASVALKDLGSSNWSLPSINNTLLKTVQDNSLKVGDFFMDLRGAISGEKYTPPLNDTLVDIGWENTVSRLEKGLKNEKSSL